MTSMFSVNVFPTGGPELNVLGIIIFSLCVNALNKFNPCDGLTCLVNKIIWFF